MRKSGILLPVFSLPSTYGIGGFSKEARQFIDFLKEAGQHYWQILPLGPMGKGNSPYQPVSCFAGEPTYIDLETLQQQGLLTEEECQACQQPEPTDRIDYDTVVEKLDQARRKAFVRWQEAVADEDAATADQALAPLSVRDFSDFCQRNKTWLPDFALYIALRREHGGEDWFDWEADLRNRQPKAIQAALEKHAEEVKYQQWCQFVFFAQWENIMDYAHQQGVEIVGDIPIYAAYESSDCWANRVLFQLNEEGAPVNVSGAPPDGFSPDGQCWGNPLYDWEHHRKNHYDWWMARLEQNFQLYDVVRLDHTRGFESYYAIPAETRDAKAGHWEKGPDMDFFHRISECLPKARFIAEDLGYLTPEVLRMIGEIGYPGMKILQFAFDSDESNMYLPKNFTTDNSVVYTGTHDNDTTMGWYEDAVDWKQRFATWYLKGNLPEHYLTGEWDVDIWPAHRIVEGMIALAFYTRCDTCMIPMQDWLGLGSDARTNLPGTPEGNWGWQMKAGALVEGLADHIRRLTADSGRI